MYKIPLFGGPLVAHGKGFPLLLLDQYNRFGLNHLIGYTKFSEQICCKVTLFYSVEESSLKVKGTKWSES